MGMDRVISSEQALKDAAASVKMEGFALPQQLLELCRQTLDGQLDRVSYIDALKEIAGVA
jgi:hypothetical protein